MKKLPESERLKSQLEKDFKRYAELLFRYGNNAHVVICKENWIYGFIWGMVFSGIITEKQRDKINREIHKIRNKYWEKYLDNTLNEQRNVKTIDKLLEQFQKNIEIILSESKEESR